MDTYKELWHSHSESWFRDVPLKEDQNLLIQAECSLISLGTERLVISEQITDITASNMQVPYMQGSFKDSFTYGYSLVGKVIRGSSNMLGKYVHLLHPHQQIASVPKEDCYVFDNLDPSLATLASNMETAINAVWDAKLKDDDQVLLIGYGLIGALVALVAQELHNCRVIVFDTNKERLKKASDQGFATKQTIEDIDESFPVAINTSANESGLQLAIDKTGYEGRIVEMSWYGSKKVSISLGNSFHYERKKIISSQVSHIPSHKKIEWNYKTRKDLVFDILRKHQPSYLIERNIDFNESTTFFNQLREKNTPDFSVIINYK